ncbi:MAG: Na/Pi cotransporter family protein [Gracilibacteraceae bacterium]|nr:Na/Pi cotransporter family protein [Gracilibacteraceae bacterium]
MLNDSMISMIEGDESKIDLVLENEEKINSMQTEITQYLVEISRKNLDSDQSAKIPALINTINNFERIGDHCEDIIELSQSKINRKISFSEKGLNELKELYQEVLEMMDECYQSYSKDDVELALKAAAREDVVDELTLKFKGRHIIRLEEGICSVQAGVIFLDAITHLERIADHLHNVCLIISENRQNEYKD